MLDSFFDHPGAVQRLRLGRLGPYLDSLSERFTRLGYSRSTVRVKMWLLRDLGRWMERRGLSVSELDESILKKFLDEVGHNDPLRRGDGATLREFLIHLRELGVVNVAADRPTTSARDVLLARYETHLKQERGLAPATQANYIPINRDFLVERFGDGPLDLMALTASDVTDFVVRRAPLVCPKRGQLMVSALRSFLRFLLQEGEIVTRLAAFVPTIAGARQSVLPKYLSPEEVERVLESCDRSTPVGCRDYAILLLLARLGLRAGEIADLRLEDVHWRTGELVVRGKGNTRDRLPVPQEVGEALAEHLRQDRRTSCRDPHVFLCARAPRRAFGRASSVSTVVLRALDRAGLKPATRGAHLLRHSLATRMLRSGASLAEIAEILRHQSLQTTEIYAKVDVDALRELAIPWPGNGGRS